MAKRWTEQEMAILREQYGRRPLKETVILLNRTEAAANNMACRLGLKKGNFKIDWPDWKIRKKLKKKLKRKRLPSGSE